MPLSLSNKQTNLDGETVDSTEKLQSWIKMLIAILKKTFDYSSF